MDIQLYEGIKYFITNLKHPRNITEEMKEEIENKAGNFIIRKDQLYWIKKGQNRRVITKKEIEKVLFNAHSSTLAGHYNAHSTYIALKGKYYWPTMCKDINEYVKSCDVCQRSQKPQRHEALNPIPVGNIFEKWGMDIIGPLNETEQGNKYIFTATEYLSKWAVAHPMTDIKASTVAKVFFDYVICDYGVPKTIITDQGTSFANELLNALCDII
jgi:Integrase zinc binding domain/Integrase core domain